MTRFLLGYIPEHTTYAEPFAGGAKLLFAKEPSKIEILNDMDDNLVNLYRIIQNSEKRQKLINFLNETPFSRSIFRAWKYGNETTPDDIEKAARYFYLCRASFAGDVHRGGFACPSKGTGRNPAQTFRTSIETFESVAKRLRNVTIECLDYADCIRRYDSPGSLFYVDCPYYGSEFRYGNTFTERDHYTLSDILHSIKGKAMVSHYQCDTYNQLYHDWQRYEYLSFKGSHKSIGGETKPRTKENIFINW